MTMELRAPDFDGRFLPPGEVIAQRFKIGEKLGEGAFGQVYLAEDTLIEADVAIKVFSKDVIKSPLDEEKFLKATRRARALTQKNVVRLHDSGVHQDHPWVSMQHLEGLNLRKVVRLRRQREEGFSLAELEPILSQVTLALQHVGRDFPHGNLKPENIIFLPDLLKITDSYILSALPEKVFAERNADTRFVAPELLTEGSEPDARCDVYSVGAIIGFMIFGNDYQPGTEAGAPGALSATDALCRRAMAFDPGERYQSVEMLNEDFTSIVDTGSRLAQSGGIVAATSDGPVPGDDEPTQVVKRSSIRREEPTSDAGSESETSEPIDPLAVETSSDIGMPLEEDMSTTEYDRDDEPRELADFLPTNEVDRDDMPPAEINRPEEKAAAKAAKPEPVEEPEKVEKPVKPKPAPKPTTPKIPTSSKRDKPKKKTKTGLTVGLIVGIVVVLTMVAGAVILGLSLTNSDDDVVDDDPLAQAEAPAADEEEAADSTEDDEEAERLAEEEEERRAEEEELRKQRSEAITAALAVPSSALDAAMEAAEEKAEELEEEEQAVAAAGAASGTGGSRPAVDPAPASCPGGMVRVSAGGEYVCVDAYQYPGRGRMPEVNVSWFDARRLCEQQDKRLCSIQEWRSACGHTYPYGGSFNADRCNTADGDGFERSLVEGGSFPSCRSPSGAYDMSGNAHEWVEEQQVAGGGFDSEADTASCRYSSAMSPGSSRGSVGFRCCKTP